MFLIFSAGKCGVSNRENDFGVSYKNDWKDFKVSDHESDIVQIFINRQYIDVQYTGVNETLVQNHTGNR